MPLLKAGLIGAHIARTRFPAALQIMCDAAGWTLDFELIDSAGSPDFDFEATVARLGRAGWSGVSVTHPFKPDAARIAGAGMVAAARHLGAANLLTFGAEPIGRNTDFTGFRAAWAHEMPGVPVGRVAMAGAGGVARALAPALADLGASEIMIWDRDAARARGLAARVGPVARAVSQAELDLGAADGLVNATPLGMADYPGSAFPADLAGCNRWAFDAVYTPTETEFLKSARRAGLRVMTGFALFQHMAIETFAAYTGVSPDRADMLAKLAVLRPEAIAAAPGSITTARHIS